MAEYIAEVRMFAGNFAPKDWTFCDGQLLSINSYPAAYSLVGTIYGGNGITTFGIPDLRGRSPIHEGQGSGLTNRTLGSRSGNETTVLSISNLPAHNHSLIEGSGGGGSSSSVMVSSGAATIKTPVDNCSIAAPGAGDGRSFTQTFGFNTSAPDVTINTGSSGGGSGTNLTVGNTGSATAFSNMSPFLTLNFIFCLNGTYPSRN